VEWMLESGLIQSHLSTPFCRYFPSLLHLQLREDGTQSDLELGFDPAPTLDPMAPAAGGEEEPMRPNATAKNEMESTWWRMDEGCRQGGHRQSMAYGTVRVPGC